MKKKILEKLQSTDGFVSGQELCELLGVSRTAVWKNIQALKNDGYVIEGVNNKGYRLVSVPDVMSEENISRQQTAGKGRRGHSWNSDKGTTISMSYLLKPDIDISCVSRITLVSAVALARAFGKVEGVKPQIKWPNDVLSDGKKLVGILTEMSSEGTDISYVVVGIGINVYNQSFPEDIADKATSILLENGRGCDRSWLIAQVSNEFEKLYDEFVKNKDLGFLVDEYNSYLVNKDKQVYVIEGDQKTEYTALGLSPDGGLLVRDADGAVRDIISGEVSVRGIYGYV